MSELDPVTVLDASAVLALVKAEQGYEAVAATLPGALLSTVNLAEVLTKLCDDGWPADEADQAIASLGIVTVEFTAGQSLAAATLRENTRSAGLSLGDRACLALGKQHHARVLTTDAIWLNIAERVGIAIVNARLSAN